MNRVAMERSETVEEEKQSRQGSVVDVIHDQVRSMAASYVLKPEERINEGALAERFGASRTPVREALNRLVAEGFLTFQSGKGFFCRPLDPQEIFDLYQVRVALEGESVRLTADRATEEELIAIRDFLHRTGPNDGGRDEHVLVELDEQFHSHLVRLSGNRELERLLDNVNLRIRFVRWIGMGESRTTTQSEHLSVVEALMKRDADGATQVMRRHIEKRREDIVTAVREGYSRIFIDALAGKAVRNGR